MPSDRVSDKLRKLILQLSCKPYELSRYGENPGAYLRARHFPEDVIEAILAGSQPLQRLLARRGEEPADVITMQGVESFIPSSAKDVAKKDSTKRKSPRKTPAKKK